MMLAIQEADAECLVHLTAEHSDTVIEIASELEMEIDEVIAWSVEMLKRYVDAGGEP